MGLGFHCKKKRIAIQLDRTYSEDALIMDASFSTPHFITLLIEHGFLKDDPEEKAFRHGIRRFRQFLEVTEGK